MINLFTFFKSIYRPKNPNQFSNTSYVNNLVDLNFINLCIADIFEDQLKPKTILSPDSVPPIILSLIVGIF